MNLTFLGAAREVTGSKYLLSANGRRILVDCGMEQGADTYENQPLPIRPDEVDCVLLTHAHIDHSGMLPALHKKGFDGPIFATPATIALCDIMLRDSAHIQEMEAEWRNRKSQRSGGKQYQPLYTQQDAEGTIALMKPLPYDKEVEILPGFRVLMTDAGHLLGSASITLIITENEISKKVVFSGDIGNLRQPILKNPQYLKQADIVIMESTYGDRVHGERPDYIADLVDTLQTTFDRGGNVIIPSFAVGRTQEILYFLREIKRKKLVHGHDGFPVYMDSPLAIKATNIFNESDWNCFDAEMQKLLNAGINPLQFEGLQLCVTADESKEINNETRPHVIISASGMCEAGRIRHHLKHNLWKQNTTILFVGYQSVGTLGRALVDGTSKVRLFGEEIAVNANIRTLKAMSGHADRDGLEQWARHFEPTPTQFYITHGAEDSALSFAELLKSQGKDAIVPYNGDCWDLVTGSALSLGPRTRIQDLGVKERKEKAEKRSREREEANTALRKAVARLNRLQEQTQKWNNGMKRQLAKQINKLCSRWE